MDSNWMWIPIGLVVLAGAIGLWASFAQPKPNELVLLAGRFEFSFIPDEDYSLPRRFDFLEGFNEGTDRYAFNVLSGEYQGQEIVAFDYHYETGDSGHTQSSDHEFGVLVVLLPAQFPRLTIEPKNIMDRMEAAFGGQDINFESAEFSKAFLVRSPDKKFAYDVCNPAMMEYLLANQDMGLEIEANVIAMQFSECLTAALVEFNLQRLCEIRSRMPEYLFDAK